MAMAKRRWSGPKTVTAAIMVIILIGTFSVKIIIEQDAIGNRRSLLLDAAAISAEEGANDERPGGRGVHPWAASRLLPLSTPPAPPHEPVLFWHVPKSGGSTVKDLHYCFRRVMAYAAKDPGEILREREENDGLWGYRDLIVTMRPAATISKQFSSETKGRALAVFRHPVERLVSKFYYLQVATWERSYRPDWKDMSLLDWARNVNWDNNHLVKQLAGRDLLAAKQTLQQYFVVGLTSQMGETVRRFNVVMGIDETKVAKCMDSFFPKDRGEERGEGGRRRRRSRRRRRQLSAAPGNAFVLPSGTKIAGRRGTSNANEHPKVEEDSEAWQLLAEKNALDMELWEYILELFEEQRGVIDFLASSRASDHRWTTTRRWARKYKNVVRGN